MYSIIIESSVAPTYGSDQAYLTYPTVFPTVSFQLVSTDDLVEAAQRLFADAGSDAAEDYTFYLGINGFTKSGLDNSVVAVDLASEDTVNIYLDEAEQAEVFAALDAQCKEKFGKGCAEMLEEARTQMSDNQYEFNPGE